LSIKIDHFIFFAVDTKTDMASDCPICANKFNGSTRKKCTCPYCQIDYCRECIGSWLTSIVDEPRCPTDTCKKPWNREFLDTIMTKVWRDSVYCEYRETLLFDRERALLPATQPRIEAINEASRIDRELIIPMRERRKVIHSQISLLHSEDQALNTQIWDLQHQSERMRQGIGIDDAAAKKRCMFIRRCPSNGCRGFLSSAWKCGVCELYSCSDCHEVKGVARDSEHTCDPGNVETAKLLAKDTKACPKCGEMITKIDGCDQMWCVSCHSAFSWRTGQIASGVVHNPHYYEWQRKQNNGEAPRNPGDIPCGGIIEWSVIRRAIANSREYPGWLSVLEAAHRRISHVQNVDITALNRDGININDNIDLRIQYLLNEIDDEAMKNKLQVREKKNEKERELRRIYETLTGAAMDIFRRLVIVAEEKGKDVENFHPLIKELNELRLFINEALDVLRRRYNSTIRGFGDNWDRIVLKKNRDEKVEVDIKTPFGIFNDIFEQIYAEVSTAAPLEQNEDGYVKYKGLSAKITKASRAARDFPRITTNTQSLAEQAINHVEFRYKQVIYSGGIRNSPNNSNYYKTRADATHASVDTWRIHAKELELIVKPMNTIE
jgi:hypothetical protein